MICCAWTIIRISPSLVESFHIPILRDITFKVRTSKSNKCKRYVEIVCNCGDLIFFGEVFRIILFGYIRVFIARQYLVLVNCKGNHYHNHCYCEDKSTHCFMRRCIFVDSKFELLTKFVKI